MQTTQQDIDRCPRETGSPLGAVLGILLTLGVMALCLWQSAP
jgi:hypothetical protein